MPPTNNGRNVKDIIPKPRYKPPLHILSEVCAHWHRIILHAPGLWAYNTIGGDLPGHFVRRALELSGTLVPLHIQVTHYRPELLAILCKYRERLRSLRVTHLHSPRARREIDSALHGRLPLLRYLRLAVGPSPLGTAQLSESTLDFVASAPQLRSLSVTGSLLRLVPRQILLQLDHLTCSVDSQDDMMCTPPRHSWKPSRRQCTTISCTYTPPGSAHSE
ncbi:hypothetical protein C8F01DRAFT_1266815 [Mycena amicta]|nr:hypothetical protein C8F01DRAFT_1266815 [Mycena amicta]